MKIYSKVVIDMETGDVVFEQSSDYVGDVARCDGGSGSGEADSEAEAESQGAGNLQGFEGVGLLGSEAPGFGGMQGSLGRSIGGYGSTFGDSEPEGLSGIGHGSISNASGMPGFGGVTSGVDISLDSVDAPQLSEAAPFSATQFAKAAVKGAMTGLSFAGPKGLVAGGIIGGLYNAYDQGAFSSIEGAPVGLNGLEGGQRPGGMGTTSMEGSSGPGPAGDPALEAEKEQAEKKVEEMRRKLRERMGYMSARRTFGAPGPVDIFTPSLFRV